MTCTYDWAVKTTELFRISATLLFVNGLYMKADTKPNTDSAAFSDCSAMQCDRAVKTTELFRISTTLLFVNGLYMKADTKPNSDAAAFSSMQC